MAGEEPQGIGDGERRRLRVEARALRKAGQLEAATAIYAQLWTQDGPRDPWDGWAYAWCLRKAGRPGDALDVCREVYRLDRTFEPNRRLYAWCVYDTELSAITGDEPADREETVLKAANAILNLCRQEAFSPYTLAVMKVVKFLERRPNGRPAEVLAWLDRLDPAKLAHEPRTLQADGDGPGRELPSERETWHLKRTRALLDLKRWAACLAACDEALAACQPSYGRSDTWLKRTRALALARLDRLDEASTALAELVLGSRGPVEWFLLAEAAEVEHRRGHHPEAWALLVRAMRIKGPLDKRVQVLARMGEVLLALAREEDARLHVELAVAIRHQQGWKIPGRLRALAAQTGVPLTADAEPSVDLKALEGRLRTFWAEESKRLSPEVDGQVQVLNAQGRIGFIRRSDGTKVFFRFANLKCGPDQLRVGAAVRFRVRPSFDRKKQKPSEEAYDIQLAG